MGTQNDNEKENEGVSTGEESGPIDVAIADKNPLVLSALSEYFDDDPRFNLVLTVKTAEGLLESLGRMQLPVAVIGWILPKCGGTGILAALRDKPDAPRIVVYSGSDDGELARKVLALGGAGFCSKSEPPERVLETVQAVARGQMVFPFVDVRELNRDPLDVLTSKERDLLAALARGRTNDQLAADFDVSVNTVKFHLRNIYDKLSLKNRAQAVAFYYSATAGAGH